jgi:hypothetical protein
LCTVTWLVCLPAGTTAATHQQSAVEVRTLDDKTHHVALDHLPRAEARVTEDDTPVTYEGVLLTDVLAVVGAPRGALLRGAALSQFVVIEARDGYRVVFALAEIDKGFSDTTVLLADRRGGVPIDDEQGPLRIVVPKEQRHGRWIRQVQRINIRQAA